MDITKEELYRYYIIDNLSRTKIASKTGMSENQIYGLIKKFGFKKDKKAAYEFARQNKTEVVIDKDVLDRLYYQEYYCAEEIGELFGYTKYVMRRYLRENGYSRTKEEDKICIERSRIRKGIKIPFDISKDELYEMYISQNLSSNEIGERFNIPGSVVRKKIRIYHIEKPKEMLLSARYRYNIQKYGEYPGLAAMHSKESIMKATAAREKTCLEKYGQKGSGGAHLSEQTRAILHNRDLFERFLEENGQMSIGQAAKKLGCSAFSIRRSASILGIDNVIKRFIKREEFEVSDFLDSLGVVHRKDRTILFPLEVDCYCPEYRIGIEFNGTYWHSSIFKDKNYHFSKSKAAKEAGVRLIHIYEHEWNDERTRPIVESILRAAFGMFEKRIYARLCEMREISTDELRSFSNSNHLQGHRNASVKYGLFYNGELVQIMSFSRNNKYEWEIIRECSKLNYMIIGGAKRLFTHFVKDYCPHSVFSYADFNKFGGDGYRRLGMSFQGYTGPDMWWIVDDVVLPRSPHKHKELKEKSDAQIWGAGSQRFLWKK